ncbi:MAG: glycosyltransferase family 4 protein [Campylobacterales bacterium]|nr:glycosyltransferase family 4 protein [Campylobacterales bacterium]
MHKHILHVNLAKGFRGGERQTLLLMSELAAKGFKQTLITRKNAPLAQRALALGLANVQVQEIAKPYIFSLGVLKKASLVHAHETQGAQFAFLGNCLFGTPFIITRRVDNSIKKNFFTKAMYRCAVCTAVLSRAIGEGVLRVCPEAKTRVIPSAFTKLATDETKIEELRQRFAGKFLIGNIGELDNAHKGQCYLIEAFKDLGQKYPALHLLFLGKGKDEALYKKMTQGAQNVSFEGFVDNVGDYLSVMDLFVFPSLHEGLGSILLDAMNAGVPIVASNAGGIPDIITHKKNGILVEPAHVEGIKQAIIALYEDRTMGAQLAGCARERVEHFSPRAMGERYETLYGEVLE